jgi:hypothetical protein
MTRKIIQIVFAPKGYGVPLVALCDDGSIWWRIEGGWRRDDTGDIPQDGVSSVIYGQSNMVVNDMRAVAPGAPDVEAARVEAPRQAEMSKITAGLDGIDWKFPAKRFCYDTYADFVMSKPMQVSE